MRRKVLVSSFYDRNTVAPALKRLEGVAEVAACTEGRTLTEEELIRYLFNVEAVIAAEELYTSSVFDHAPGLRIITRDGVGLDSIDLDEASRRGIIVNNAPVVHESVADLTMGLLIAVVRKILTGDEGTRSGRWNRREAYISPDVNGLTLGLLGFGAIGQAVAKRAAGFGMRLMAYDIKPDREKAREIGVGLVDFHQLLEETDVLSIHVALNEKTHFMINRRTLGMMRKGSFLINTSRGAVVDEKALYQALKSGRLAGAGLDVLSREPPASQHPLFSLDNVVLTPHMGSDTYSAFLKVYQSAVTDLLLFFDGKLPRHVVNPGVLNHPYCRNLKSANTSKGGGFVF